MDSSGELVRLREAQGGDERAFEELVGGRQVELRAHCYRILASLDDADDAVQETLVRAWKGLGRFEGRSSVRTWLYAIATNAALDIAIKRKRRELPIDVERGAEDGDPSRERLGELRWVGPYPSADSNSWYSPQEDRSIARENVELAFVTVLQYLPARQRAAFLLREVLGFSAVETAQALEVTVFAVNSSLQRARAHVNDLVPKVSQHAELRALGDAGVQELASQYSRAIERGDIGALLQLLTEDATWSMPPLAETYRGRHDIAAFQQDSVFPQQWRHLTAEANGQLAVAGYLFDVDRDCYVATALDVLELRDGRIAAVTGFLTDAAFTPEELGKYPASRGLFPRLGLPPELSI
jgi:RNA polymerase sigma-70 factor, ECF subfamily